MDFPHIAIRESVDRSWTPFLLAAFEDPSTPDQARRELRLTLMDPGDPRAIERLLDVLVDPRADTGVRAASAELLGSQGWIPDSYETRRAWWHSGDPVLQRAALGEMDDHHDGDLVYAVASDPQHPHHRTVLMRSFCWSFAAPRFQPFKLAGLRHEDARVREYMAWEIMVDETAAAEPDLHRLARDADADVRDAAHYALEYFPTRQTLRFADECRDDTDLARIADYLAGEFGDAAAAHPGLAEWMKPVEEIVGRRVVSDACDDDGEPDDRVHTPPRPAPVRLPVDAWLERLANPDGEWASFGVRNCYWSIPHVDLDAVAGPDRQRLTRALIHHADPAIRGGAAYVAAAWDDLDALLQLAHDNQRSVRFSAVYNLGQMPKDPAVARFLADLLDGRPPRRFKLSETLASWTHHADPADAVARHRAIALDTARPDTHRLSGLWSLWRDDDRHRHEAAETVRQLLPELAQSPAVSWQWHVTLLESCKRFGIDPMSHAAWLEETDNLHVRVALL